MSIKSPDSRLIGHISQSLLDQPVTLTSPSPPLSLSSSLEEIHAFYTMCEPMMQQMMSIHCKNSLQKISSSYQVETVMIEGIDGNQITLSIYTPTDLSLLPSSLSPSSCIYYIHGGGMCLRSSNDSSYRYIYGALASLGVTVVAVEFRNSSGSLGNHPFPAGLNDCMSGLLWTYEQKEQRNLSKIIIAGESGGGNLTLALCLKAKKESQLHLIDGVVGLCPFIFGQYKAVDTPEWNSLPSLRDNDGLFLECQGLALISKLYTPDESNHKNPLAWPFWAELDDLLGLPPHFMSINEFDPLRDEGKEYYRKLLRAGVRAELRTVHGTLHAFDLIMPDYIPHIVWSTLHAIVDFARDV